jgi:DNA-binding Lrp family transcriptional regulator
MIKDLSALAKVIYVARFSADEAIHTISRKAQMSSKRTQEVLDDALAQGLIKPFCIINQYILGFKQYTFHLEVAPPFVQPLREFLSSTKVGAIIKHISWAAVVDHNYNFIISLLVRDYFEVLELFNKLSQVIRIRKKLLVANITFELYAPRFIAPIANKATCLSIGIQKKLITADEIDSTILRTLSIHPEVSNQDLAAQCKCSPSKISRRISKLREQGVLVASSYLINSYALGLRPYKILVSLSTLDRGQISSVRSWIAQDRSIAYVIRTIGAWDFEIGIEVPTHAQALQTSDDFRSYLGDHCAEIQLIQIQEDLISRPYPF